ncbi:hypothetical protein MAR_024670, partial [Mya arenaria]
RQRFWVERRSDHRAFPAGSLYVCVSSSNQATRSLTAGPEGSMCGVYPHAGQGVGQGRGGREVKRGVDSRCTGTHPAGEGPQPRGKVTAGSHSAHVPYASYSVQTTMGSVTYFLEDLGREDLGLPDLGREVLEDFGFMACCAPSAVYASSMALSSSSRSCSSAFSSRFSPPTMIFFSIAASFWANASCSSLHTSSHITILELLAKLFNLLLELSEQGVLWILIDLCLVLDVLGTVCVAELVFEFPPRESCSSLVSLEFLYGMCELLPSTRADMTLPRVDRDRLILVASFNRWPENQTPRECLLRGHNMPEECKCHRIDLYKCKRSQVDARTRFRGKHDL